MCGIAGVLGRPGLDPERSEIVRRMTATLVHRGPDGEGLVRRDGCDLGFRRLAIVDPQGEARIFSNEDETVWSVCNGEIYNSSELRSLLESRGHRLETGVDTEVLPHLWEEHGPKLVSLLDGMFAFAVWDERRSTLFLARDRAGEKPLFYWSGGEELVFASELRALLAHPRLPRALDPVGIRRYLLHDYFPAPLTPLAAVRKLPAAHHLIARHGQAPEIGRYWDLASSYREAPREPGSEPTAGEVAGELDELIATAVRRRKRSDVPVGVFLSGGIDSSGVLAHLADQEGPGVPAFSLGHTDPSFDESSLARRTANHFDADFSELVLDEEDLADGLRRVGEGFDEPLGDASIIPTHLLSLHARERVKVILSGEGADELFAGYPTYFGDRIAERFRRLPASLRRGLVRASRLLTPVKMGNVGLDYLVERFGQSAEWERVERHHRWFGSLPPEDIDRVLAPALVERFAGDDPFGSARALLEGRDLPDGLSSLLYMDFSMYLQDDLLTKVDRASMLASLEVRAPYLDHELAEYVAALPSSLKLRRLKTKLVLRRSLEGRLPEEVFRRRKRGFNIPLSRWLLHGLGEQMRERFSPERVEARGILSAAGMKILLDEHMSQRHDHRKPIFSLLALDLWCDRTFGEGAPVPLAESHTATTETGTVAAASP